MFSSSKRRASVGHVTAKTGTTPGTKAVVPFRGAHDHSCTDMAGTAVYAEQAYSDRTPALVTTLLANFHL